MKFGNCIFGDNQFLGVNHYSQKKAINSHEKFKKISEIINVLGYAYESGIRDFMFTCHDRYEEVFKEVTRSNLFPGLYFSPCLPYAHKYWNKLSEKGLIGLATSTILQINPLRIFPALSSVVFGKKEYFTKLLIDIEILMTKGLPIRGIFLQNLAFDFLMSMELSNIISCFHDVVFDRFGVIPGFITMNHPKAVATLCDEITLSKPWICANYNISGFRMHPSQILCEDSFQSKKSNNIAMSVMSSGEYSPEESLKYVAKNLTDGSVNSILFGSSKKKNIQNNFNAINNYSVI